MSEEEILKLYRRFRKLARASSRVDRRLEKSRKIEAEDRARESHSLEYDDQMRQEMWMGATPSQRYSPENMDASRSESLDSMHSQHHPPGQPSGTVANSRPTRNTDAATTISLAVPVQTLSRTESSNTLPVPPSMKRSNSAFSINSQSSDIQVTMVDSSNNSCDFISKDGFLSMEVLSTNPLRHRLFHIFDRKKRDRISFEDFLVTMNAFHIKASRAEKIEFTYKLLDNNNKGYFAQEDLREVFINLFGAQTDAVRRHIESFVQKLILEADLTHDGKISFQEFSKIMDHADIMELLTIRLS